MKLFPRTGCLSFLLLSLWQLLFSQLDTISIIHNSKSANLDALLHQKSLVFIDSSCWKSTINILLVIPGLTAYIFWCFNLCNYIINFYIIKVTRVKCKSYEYGNNQAEIDWFVHIHLNSISVIL